ncbi:MAG TPA: HK97 family phage prohead protease [Arenicellales bacterium]|nr:HK97 family phage prohead protease [Arenicellales bacterium]
MEFKRLALDGAALKFDETREGFFSGYASVFGGLDAYGDTIKPGAYRKTLRKRERPIRMRWNHFGPVIGKWLKLEEDDVGLFVEGELTPGHSVASNVYASMKHGAVDGMSIGYRPVKIEDHGDGTRTLKEIELVEISVVEEPADLGARVGDVKHVTALIEQIESWKEVESLLREAGGFSRTAATALVSRVKSLSLGEPEPVADLAKYIQRISV